MPTIRPHTQKKMHCTLAKPQKNTIYKRLWGYQIFHLPYHLACAEMEQELWSILKEPEFIDLQYQHTTSASVCMDSFRQGLALYIKNRSKESSLFKQTQIIYKSLSFLHVISDDLYDSVESFRNHQKTLESVIDALSPLQQNQSFMAGLWLLLIVVEHKRAGVAIEIEATIDIIKARFFSVEQNFQWQSNIRSFALVLYIDALLPEFPLSDFQWLFNTKDFLAAIFDYLFEVESHHENIWFEYIEQCLKKEDLSLQKGEFLMQLYQRKHRKDATGGDRVLDQIGLILDTFPPDKSNYTALAGQYGFVCIQQDRSEVLCSLCQSCTETMKAVDSTARYEYFAFDILSRSMQSLKVGDIPPSFSRVIKYISDFQDPVLKGLLYVRAYELVDTQTKTEIMEALSCLEGTLLESLLQVYQLDLPMAHEYFAQHISSWVQQENNQLIYQFSQVLLQRGGSFNQLVLHAFEALNRKEKPQNQKMSLLSLFLGREIDGKREECLNQFLTLAIQRGEIDICLQIVDAFETESNLFDGVEEILMTQTLTDMQYQALLDRIREPEDTKIYAAFLRYCIQHQKKDSFENLIVHISAEEQMEYRLRWHLRFDSERLMAFLAQELRWKEEKEQSKHEIDWCFQVMEEYYEIHQRYPTTWINLLCTQMESHRARIFDWLIAWLEKHPCIELFNLLQENVFACDEMDYLDSLLDGAILLYQHGHVDASFVLEQGDERIEDSPVSLFFFYLALCLQEEVSAKEIWIRWVDTIEEIEDDFYCAGVLKDSIAAFQKHKELHSVEQIQALSEVIQNIKIPFLYQNVMMDLVHIAENMKNHTLFCELSNHIKAETFKKIIRNSKLRFWIHSEDIRCALQILDDIEHVGEQYSALCTVIHTCRPHNTSEEWINKLEDRVSSMTAGVSKMRSQIGIAYYWHYGQESSKVNFYTCHINNSLSTLEEYYERDDVLLEILIFFLDTGQIAHLEKILYEIKEDTVKEKALKKIIAFASENTINELSAILFRCLDKAATTLCIPTFAEIFNGRNTMLWCRSALVFIKRNRENEPLLTAIVTKMHKYSISPFLEQSTLFLIQNDYLTVCLYSLILRLPHQQRISILQLADKEDLVNIFIQPAEA